MGEVCWRWTVTASMPGSYVIEWLSVSFNMTVNGGILNVRRVCLDEHEIDDPSWTGRALPDPKMKFCENRRASILRIPLSRQLALGRRWCTTSPATVCALYILNSSRV